MPPFTDVAPGWLCDPFKVERIIVVTGSVGGAALAHGYSLSAFQAEEGSVPAG